MTIRFSRDAVADLQAISEYTIENWGEDQEILYLKQIYARLEDIGRDPARFRKRDELFDGCRSASAGRHVVFFLQTEGVLVVSRILHQSMDFTRHIYPDW